MRRSLPILALCATAFVLVARQGLESDLAADRTAERPAPIPPREGLKDDPRARIRWETDRLKDPATGMIPPDIRRRELEFSLRQARMPRTDAAYTSAAWTFRGPKNMGGRTRALAIDKSDASGRTFLAGGASGGLFRSTDEGASWTETTFGIGLFGATCLAQDPRAGHTSTWWVGTGELYNSSFAPGADAEGQGIFKSTDGGRTWRQLAATEQGSPTRYDFPFDYVWNIAVDPTNNNQEEVYAAVISGIFRSTDGGESWTQVLGNAAGSVANFTDVVVTPSGVLYAALDTFGDQTGIYRSTDGLQWTKISPGSFPQEFYRISLGVAPSNTNVVYAIMQAQGPATGHALYKYTYVSGDGSGAGGTWTDRSSALAGLPVAPSNNSWDFDSQRSYDLLVAVHPTDENQVFIGGVHLIRSTDGFASNNQRAWIGGWLYPDPNGSVPFEHHADQHVLIFSPTNPSVAYSGCDGGIWKTTNISAGQVRWTSLNNGYTTAQFYHAAVDQATSGSAVVIGGMQDNNNWYTNSTNSSAPWIELGGGDGAFDAVSNGATSGGYFYVSSQFAHCYREDRGADGQPRSNPYYAYIRPAGRNDQDFLFVNPLALDPNESKRMYLASQLGLYRNSDLTGIPPGNVNPTSVNWTQVTSVGQVSALGVATTPLGLVYYGTQDGQLYKLTNAHTAPAGTTPTQVSGGTFPGNAYLGAIGVDPTDGQKVLVSFTNYGVASIFYTSNGGQSWTDVEGNLAGADGPSVRSVAILPLPSGSVYFAATSTGLYSTSTLNGSSTVWQFEGEDTMGHVLVDWVVTRPSDGLVVAATHGRGLFSTNFGSSNPQCATLSGDADGNATINVLDVVKVVNHILSIEELSAGAQICANVNGDGRIDVLDAVGIVQIILGFAPDGGGHGSSLAFVRTDARPGGCRIEIEGKDLVALQLDLPGVTGSPVLEAGPGELRWSEVGGALRLVLMPAPTLAPADHITFWIPGARAVEPEGLVLVDARGRMVETAPRSGTAALDLSAQPNPSRGAVSLSYRLPLSGGVDVSVFDTQGRRVRHIDHSWQERGTHGATWDGTTDSGQPVPSGAYWVLVRASDRRAVERVHILR